MANDINNDTKPEEPLCPYWQKKCSEVNTGKVVCKRLITAHAVKTGSITTQPIYICQDDFIASTTQKVLQIFLERNKQIVAPRLFRG